MPNLLIETTATHGVIPLANPSLGGLRPAIAQTESTLSLKYDDGTRVPLPIKVYSSLGTGQWARMVAEPIDAASPDGDAQVKWNGADISAKFGSTTTYEGSIGALDFEGNGARIATTPLTVKGTFKQQGVFVFSESESSMSLDKVTLTPPAGTQQGPIVLNDLRGMGSVELVGDRAVAVSNLSIGGIDNSTLQINRIDMVANYDIDALALSDFIKRIAQAPVQRRSDNDDAMAANAEATLAAMSQILIRGARLKLEQFDIAVDGGTMTMDLTVDVPAGSNSPQAAMSNGQAAGNVVIPDAVVKTLGALSPEIAGGLTMAANDGVCAAKGRRLSLKCQLQRRRATAQRPAGTAAFLSRENSNLPDNHIPALQRVFFIHDLDRLLDDFS